MVELLEVRLKVNCFFFENLARIGSGCWFRLELVVRYLISSGAGFIFKDFLKVLPAPLRSAEETTLPKLDPYRWQR